MYKNSYVHKYKSKYNDAKYYVTLYYFYIFLHAVPPTYFCMFYPFYILFQVVFSTFLFML